MCLDTLPKNAPKVFGHFQSSAKTALMSYDIITLHEWSMEQSNYTAQWVLLKISLSLHAIREMAGRLSGARRAAPVHVHACTCTCTWAWLAKLKRESVGCAKPSKTLIGYHKVTTMHPIVFIGVLFLVTLNPESMSGCSIFSAYGSYLFFIPSWVSLCTLCLMNLLYLWTPCSWALLTLRGWLSQICDITAWSLFKLTTLTNLSQSPKN